MPKPIFSTIEKIEGTAGRFGDAHTQAEMDTNIVEALRTPGASKDMANARGRLVRLTGGLPGLPFILAGVEQEFIVPKNIQSLIFEDLVPSLVASAILPRWWQVTPTELHGAALYQRFGEELVTSAGQDASLREKVVGILAPRMLSRRLGQLEKALESGHPEEVLPGITPAETFYLALEFQRRYPAEVTRWGKTGTEIQMLIQEDPEEINKQRLSEDFGVPHPALAKNTACELLNLRPFPTFLGYSSYLLAESWESNNLYWARLADEKGLSPERLNLLVPALTHRMVENIFATHLDDWPALLRALRETGTEFREGKLESLPIASAASPL